MASRRIPEETVQEMKPAAADQGADNKIYSKVLKPIGMEQLTWAGINTR